MKTSLKHIKKCNDLLLRTLEDKQLLSLSGAVDKIREELPSYKIWGRFEYKGKWIFIVSDDKPGIITSIAPGTTRYYSLDKKTSEMALLSPHYFWEEDTEKIMKAMNKTIILMDITNLEYDPIRQYTKNW